MKITLEGFVILKDGNNILRDDIFKKQEHAIDSLIWEYTNKHSEMILDLMNGKIKIKPVTVSVEVRE